MTDFRNETRYGHPFKANEIILKPSEYDCMKNECKPIAIWLDKTWSWNKQVLLLNFLKKNTVSLENVCKVFINEENVTG